MCSGTCGPSFNRGYCEFGLCRGTALSPRKPELSSADFAAAVVALYFAIPRGRASSADSAIFVVALCFVIPRGRASPTSTGFATVSMAAVVLCLAISGGRASPTDSTGPEDPFSPGDFAGNVLCDTKGPSFTNKLSDCCCGGDFRRDLRLLEHAPEALLGNRLGHLRDFRRDLRHWHLHDVLRVLLHREEGPQLCPPTCTLASASVHVGTERPPAHRVEPALFQWKKP